MYDYDERAKYYNSAPPMAGQSAPGQPPQGPRGKGAALKAIVGIVVVLVVVLGGFFGYKYFISSDGSSPSSASSHGGSNSTGADESGNSWSGKNGDVIQLRDLDPNKPIKIVNNKETFSGKITGPGGSDINVGNDVLRFITVSKEATNYFVPLAPDLDIEVESDGKWEATITQPDLPKPKDGIMSGTGPATFIYQGDATTARFSADGLTPYLAVITDADLPDRYTVDNGNERSIAWPDANLVIFSVDADKDDSWQIALTTQKPISKDFSITHEKDNGSSPADSDSDDASGSSVSRDDG